MSNSTHGGPKLVGKTRSLKEALDFAKNREADRSDVVVDMKAAEQARLELLANELRPLLNEIDETDERFDFALTKGERPRLWIDMTSFVVMGHDKRSYRFLKDTRMGRMVLAETHDMDKAADIVSEYVADKVLERERAMEGEWESLKNSTALTKDVEGGALINTSRVGSAKTKPSIWKSLGWFIFGAFCCVAALAAVAFVLVPDAF
ncbi:MAG: hypothetical protein V3V02_09515 [Rhizobiaceae bacterium]